MIVLHIPSESDEKKTNSERLHRRKLESQKTRMSDSSEQTE